MLMRSEDHDDSRCVLRYEREEGNAIVCYCRINNLRIPPPGHGQCDCPLPVGAKCSPVIQCHGPDCEACRDRGQEKCHPRREGGE